MFGLHIPAEHNISITWHEEQNNHSLLPSDIRLISRHHQICIRFLGPDIYYEIQYQCHQDIFNIGSDASCHTHSHSLNQKDHVAVTQQLCHCVVSLCCVTPRTHGLRHRVNFQCNASSAQQHCLPASCVELLVMQCIGFLERMHQSHCVSMARSIKISNGVLASLSFN